jgi:hypothetical protein
MSTYSPVNAAAHHLLELRRDFARRHPLPPQTPEERERIIRLSLSGGAPPDLRNDVADDWTDKGERFRQLSALANRSSEERSALEARREADILARVAEYVRNYPALVAEYESALVVYRMEQAHIIDRLPADLRGNERATAERLCEIHLRRMRRAV